MPRSKSPDRIPLIRYIHIEFLAEATGNEYEVIRHRVLTTVSHFLESFALWSTVATTRGVKVTCSCVRRDVVTLSSNVPTDKPCSYTSSQARHKCSGEEIKSIARIRPGAVSPFQNYKTVEGCVNIVLD